MADCSRRLLRRGEPPRLDRNLAGPYPGTVPIEIVIAKSSHRRHVLLGALPLLAWVLLINLLRPEPGNGSSSRSWVGALVRASLAWGVFVSLTTELLGAFSAIGRPAIIAVWLAAVAVLLMMHRFTGTYLPTSWPRLPKSPLIGIAVLMCAALLLIAWCAPPNTWDTLTYHMPRVMHWIQSGSLAHYPTGILRQLWNAPWSEYVFLNFHVLAGTDRFANLVQWFAMTGSLITAGSITLQLSRNTAARDWVIILIVTMPTGMLQATGTQNSYVTTFWLLCALHIILRIGDSVQPRMSDIVCFALAAALAIATKPIAWFWVAGLAIWCLASVGRRSLRSAAGLVASCVLATLILSGPLWLRNYQLFGAPLAPRQYDVHNPKLTVDAMTPRLFASNLTRNLSLHCGTLIPGANELVERTVANVHRLLRVSPNDPRTTDHAFRVSSGKANEDEAASPLHVLLAIFGVGAVFARPSLRRNRRLLCLSLVCLLGVILFLTVLRWQPWATRLQLPGLVLTMVIAAIAGGGGSARRGSASPAQRRPAMFIRAVFIVASLPALLSSTQRPLLPWPRSVLNLSRVSQLRWHSDVSDPLDDLFARLRENGSRRIGLALGPNGPEYLFWAALAPTGKEVMLFHVDVENQSRVCASVDPAPDAVVLGPYFLKKGAHQAYRARGWSVVRDGRFAVAFPPT